MEKYTLMEKGEYIQVNNEVMNRDQFAGLLRRGLNHTITFQNGTAHHFIVERQFGSWVIQPPAAAACSLGFYFDKILRDLIKYGKASLMQDSSYLN